MGFAKSMHRIVAMVIALPENLLLIVHLIAVMLIVLQFPIQRVMRNANITMDVTLSVPAL
jgi:hypothetical protein